MSLILEDEQGFHIVRVIERRAESYVPFTEAQVKIKNDLRQERIKEGIREYVGRLRANTTVWTAFNKSEEDARR